MLFWDEFTSLLEVTERRSILNCMQDIAELSKAPRKDGKDKFIGVYVFLVTHKSMEATDSYKELKRESFKGFIRTWEKRAGLIEELDVVLWSRLVQKVIVKAKDDIRLSSRMDLK